MILLQVESVKISVNEDYTVILILTKYAFQLLFSDCPGTTYPYLPLQSYLILPHYFIKEIFCAFQPHICLALHNRGSSCPVTTYYADFHRFKSIEKSSVSSPQILSTNLRKLPLLTSAHAPNFCQLLTLNSTSVLSPPPEVLLSSVKLFPYSIIVL